MADILSQEEIDALFSVTEGSCFDNDGDFSLDAPAPVEPFTDPRALPLNSPRRHRGRYDTRIEPDAERPIYVRVFP